MLLESINAGDFRTRMSLQIPVRTRNSDGSFAPMAWAALRSVWTSFIPLDNPTRPARNTWSAEGTEKQFAGQQRSQQKHIIFIRAQPEKIGTDWRLVKVGSDNRVFNIREALLISNVRKMVRIVAEENVSQKDDPIAAFNVVMNEFNRPVYNEFGEFVISQSGV